MKMGLVIRNAPASTEDVTMAADAVRRMIKKGSLFRLEISLLGDYEKNTKLCLQKLSPELPVYIALETVDATREDWCVDNGCNGTQLSNHRMCMFAYTIEELKKNINLLNPPNMEHIECLTLNIHAPESCNFTQIGHLYILPDKYNGELFFGKDVEDVIRQLILDTIPEK